MELLEQILEYVIAGAYWYLVIASVAVVLLENKNPVRTVAWVLLLLFLPYFGLLLYVVFGRSFKRQSRLTRKMRMQMVNDIELALQHRNEGQNNPLLEQHSTLTRLLSRTAHAPVFANNNVDIYTDGKKLLDDMLADIEALCDEVFTHKPWKKFVRSVFSDKRLRPLLTLLSARLFGAEGPQLYELAVIPEMIHVATLLHDDVLDEDVKNGKFDKNHIELLHSKNISCNVFFADTFENYKMYFDMGIDTILTNDYNLISQIVKK